MKLHEMKFKHLGIFLILFIFLLLPKPDNLYATVTLVAPSGYSTLPNPDIGTVYYVDRSYTITSQPAALTNYTEYYYTLILTKNNDKHVDSEEHIKLSLSTATTVYVAYDSRASTLPSWLQSSQGFSSTGDSVGTTDVTLNLYKKDFSAGEVIFGGNWCGRDTGAESNYIVYIAEPTTPPPLEVDPTSLILGGAGDTATATVSGGTTPYSVSSGTPSVATATVSGDTVTVTGVADGNATITITDSANPSDSVAILVIVDSSLAVLPTSMILIEGGVGTATISGGTSPYTVSSNLPSVATVTLSDNTVNVIGIADGSATITITDNASDSVIVSITVVTPLSVSPTALNLSANETAAVTVSGGTSPYNAVSANDYVATATISGNTVTITAVAAGNISVTITDSASNIATVIVYVGGAIESGLGTCPMAPFVSDVKHNILLILDHSGSMGSGSGSKWDTARTVLMNIIDEFPEVRFGLMRMDGSNYNGNDHWYSSSKVIRQGGKILKHCGTSGNEIRTYIANWGDANNPQTWTNLAETLASAGQYFATVSEGGSRVGKGPTCLGYYEKNYHYSGCGGSCDATYTDDKGNIINTTSPIQYYCQKSFIIFITDGLANYDDDWNIVTDVIGDYDGDGQYFDDVAKYLYENDMRSDLDEKQNITTYVIGFHIDEPLLSSAAEKGGGKYYTASNASGLTEALKVAIRDILDKVGSGSAVSTISTSSESDDYLIRAKFMSVSWKGYLEAYTLPYDATDTPVWEAGKLLQDNIDRHIYTRMSSETPKKQEFVDTNTALKTYLSSTWVESESETADIMNFIRGDATYEGDKYRNRGGWPLGDIIYSTPVSVGPPKFYYTKNDYQTFKANNSDRKTMIYVGANDGMLHAFRAKDDLEAYCDGVDAGSELCAGSEQWAYIPESIQFVLNSLTEEDCHKYYVDLSPVATDIWDGSSWKTVLIGGNRLGGEGFFCLDVTDPTHNAFSILWDTIPFSDRRSSAVPAVGKVKAKDGEVDKWLAIITSGYHEGTSEGKIAALNATNGTKETIWYDGTSNVTELTTQAKGADSDYYTLSSPAALDSDGDGYLDLIYAGDTEGSLWKFYYDYVNTIWKKVVFFQTEGQAITAKPALVFDEDGKLRIYFGTGKYLVDSDKMNSIRNAFYCLIEDKVTTEDANNNHYTSTTPLIKADDLVELTSVTTQAAFNSLSEADQAKIGNNGWYFQLDEPASPAERVVEEAISIAGIVFFTSFIPNADVCGYGGDSRLYAINYRSGLPGKEGEESVLEDVEAGSRYKELGQGFAGKPVFYFDRKKQKSKLFVQTSDATLHEEAINLEDKPMAISSWKSD